MDVRPNFMVKEKKYWGGTQQQQQKETTKKTNNPAFTSGEFPKKILHCDSKW